MNLPYSTIFFLTKTRLIAQGIVDPILHITDEEKAVVDQLNNPSSDLTAKILERLSQ